MRVLIYSSVRRALSSTSVECADLVRGYIGVVRLLTVFPQASSNRCSDSEPKVPCVLTTVTGRHLGSQQQAATAFSKRAGLERPVGDLAHGAHG